MYLSLIILSALEFHTLIVVQPRWLSGVNLLWQKKLMQFHICVLTTLKVMNPSLPGMVYSIIIINNYAE